MQRRENEAANPSSEASSFPLVDFISKVSDKMSCKEFRKNVYFDEHLLTSQTDDITFGAGTFSWQDPVHSWKAGLFKVVTVENLFIFYIGNK